MKGGEDRVFKKLILYFSPIEEERMKVAKKKKFSRIIGQDRKRHVSCKRKDPSMSFSRDSTTATIDAKVTQACQENGQHMEAWIDDRMEAWIEHRLKRHQEHMEAVIEHHLKRQREEMYAMFQREIGQMKMNFQRQIDAIIASMNITPMSIPPVHFDNASSPCSSVGSTSMQPHDDADGEGDVSVPTCPSRQ